MATTMSKYKAPGQEEREEELLKGKPKTEVFKEDPNQQPKQETRTEEREIRYNTDYPFAPIVGPEYFENRKQKEKELLEKRSKREKARMTAGALADTLRLIGHGAAINKGAYETKWGRNENIDQGINSLNQYRDEYANVLRNIEDAEMRDQLAGKEFNYREFLRRSKEKQAADQRADERAWREKTYKDSQDWREGQFDYKKERDEEADKRWRLGHELDKKRVANSRWYNQQRAKNQSGNKDKEDTKFPFRYDGNEYGIDFSNKDHKAGLAHMANNYLSTLEEELNNMSQEAWRKIENSDLYQSVKKLSDRDWPDDFAAINTILPDFFDPEIAQEYDIPYEQLPGKEQPTYGPTREDMKTGLDPDLKSDVIRTLERQRQEKEGQATQPTSKQDAPEPSQQEEQTDTTTQEVFPEQNVKNLSGKEITDLRPIEKQNLLEADWPSFDPRKDQDAMRLKRDAAIDRFMRATEADPGTDEKLEQAAIEMYNYLKYAKPQQLVNKYGNVTPEVAIENLMAVLKESKN